jgi:hypothetical protein
MLIHARNRNEHGRDPRSYLHPQPSEPLILEISLYFVYLVQWLLYCEVYAQLAIPKTTRSGIALQRFDNVERGNWDQITVCSSHWTKSIYAFYPDINQRIRVMTAEMVSELDFD